MDGVLVEMNCDEDVSQSDRFYLLQPHCYIVTQATHVSLEKHSGKRQPRFQVVFLGMRLGTRLFSVVLMKLRLVILEAW